ncbi:hypothetical protein J5N97_014025 [Dioscorea zingiberensis]|uniref:Uncharacterized protein n=1 Tax=Dioscorea zingiberensis TaxID=325984 RepID=A0A9D5CRU9_9LILI|nr:hypothetical protein J5N97_014025 [Dioscorea zingiberensis]
MLSNSLFDSLLISSIPAVGSRFNGYPFRPNLTSLLRSFAGPSSAHRRVRLPPLSKPLSIHRAEAMDTEIPFDSSTGNLTELNTEADFHSLCSPDGFLSICGFGSLLSEKSARSTFPELRDFRVGVLRGFRRVFAHVAPIFYDRGIARPDTGEVSSLSVEPCEGEWLVVTVFEIKKEEVSAFMEREHEFRFLAVFPEDLEGKPFTRPAVICARYSDDEYFRIRCKGSKEIFFQRYGRYNIDKIWRDDILPCRVYLRHCVLAAKNLSENAYDNFLDHTFISNRKTTIREYLASRGSGIMEEEPPEELKSRYGG